LNFLLVEFGWRATVERVYGEVSAKERVTVASEKAGFIADRIAAGIPADEEEVRKLARYLRETAALIGMGWKKSRPASLRAP